jgi:hypothetical protein
LLTLAELDAMNGTGTTETDRTNLVDIRTVKIDASLPAALRTERYLEQIRNPYCFLCGEAVVRIRFEPNGEDLKNRLKNYLKSLKKA